MNRRALLVATVLAVLGVALLVLYVRRFEEEASGGERIKLLVAVKPIDRGAAITDEMVAVRDVPQAYVEDRAVKASEKQKVLGLRVGNAVQPQETLLWTDLAIANDERRDLSSLVQPGNRAVSVRAIGDEKSHALIRPGDYVDVIATMGTGGDQQRSAVVLLQRILVLAVGLETVPETMVEKKETSSSKEMTLTLSLNLQEAQMISLAAERGKLAVALRNPEDQRIVEGIPDMPQTALSDRGMREKVQSIRRTGPVKLESAGAGAR